MGVEIIAVRIITDSTCDLLPEDQKRFEIDVIPLSVHFADADYHDGVDITREEFYCKLEQSEQLPTTAMVPPGEFSKVFQRHVDAGDEVVAILISSEISGTYHSACIAREGFDEGAVIVLDSRSASLSLALLVAEAVRLRDECHSATELAQRMEPLIQKVRFFAAVNTLKYLRKGGRISATSAVVGELLGIKPIVSIVEGSILSVGKARGMAAAVDHILQEVKRNLPNLAHKVVFAHSGAPDLMERTIAMMKAPLGLHDWLCCEVGAVIGTYAGRGCLGFAYIAE